MNISLKHCGWRRLWRTVIKPEIFDRVFDDRYTDRLKIKSKVRAIAAKPQTRVFSAYWNRKFAGCVVLYPIGNGVFEVHTLLLKAFHGLFAVRIGRFATRQILSFDWCNRLVSFCPENLPETYLFSRLCGWKSDGYMAEKWVKNGIEYRMKKVTISKGDLCPS